jgi:addiction module HigA family antidote
MTKEKIEVGMTPSHPGQFIRTDIIEELGLTIDRTAKLLDVRAATLSDLINEKSSLSPEMALRIEMAFSVRADLLLRMQAWYDSVAIRSRAAELNVQRYQPV